MKLSGGRTLATIAPMLFIALWASSYHPFEFKGGLGLRDSGLFSGSPRYHAHLGYIPLWKAGEYQFTVHGLPPGPLDLTLPVLDATIDDRPELTSSSTSLRVSITDSSGKEICTANGILSDARTRGVYTWELDLSTSHASFWHERCRDLPISRFTTYVVKVTVADVDARAPHKTIVPELDGGWAIELP